MVTSVARLIYCLTFDSMVTVSWLSTISTVICSRSVVFVVVLVHVSGTSSDQSEGCFCWSARTAVTWACYFYDGFFVVYEWRFLGNRTIVLIGWAADISFLILSSPLILGLFLGWISSLVAVFEFRGRLYSLWICHVTIRLCASCSCASCQCSARHFNAEFALYFYCRFFPQLSFFRMQFSFIDFKDKINKWFGFPICHIP